MKKSLIALLALAPLCLLAAPKTLVDVQVHPKQANLSTSRDRQLLVVQAKLR